MRTLVIGNKCYSSWSLRPWILMRMLGLDFDEVLVPLDRPETADTVAHYSPAGKVPVLIDDGVTVWDSLAIIEHLAETTDAGVWPEAPAARAMARSIAAEMHAGFPLVRANLPMNLGRRYVYHEVPDVRPELERLHEIVKQARSLADDGPFLFGAFTAADAMYAPVMSRLWTYSVPVGEELAAYRDAVLGTAAFQDWRKAALEEPWVVSDDEVGQTVMEEYRPRPATERTA